MTLYEARTRRGWTQEELEAKSGIDQTTISGLENGRSTNPTFTTVCRLARALRVRPEALNFGHIEASR